MAEQTETLERVASLAWATPPELGQRLALEAADALGIVAGSVRDLSKLYTHTAIAFRRPEAFHGKALAFTFLPATLTRGARTLVWVNPAFWTTTTYRVERLEILASAWLRSEAWISALDVALVSGAWQRLCRAAGVAATESGSPAARAQAASMSGAEANERLVAADDRPACILCSHRISTGDAFGDKPAHRGCVQAAGLRAGVRIHA